MTATAMHRPCAADPSHCRVCGVACQWMTPAGSPAEASYRPDAGTGRVVPLRAARPGLTSEEA